MRYRPVAGRGHFEGVADTGSRSGFGGSAEDWRRYRNSYRNTLLWNVGGFFDRLFARADLSHATLVYTGDHGQDLHERGNPGLATHCSSDPAPQEGLVPLVVIEGAGRRTLDWERTLAARRDHVSHYGIFPTLLALMGYAETEIRPLYGDTIAAPAPDKLSFNARFNARLGREPDWRLVDPAKIPAPPADEQR
jgi:lipid A ethanolaminephosphotransferase